MKKTKLFNIVFCLLPFLLSACSLLPTMPIANNSNSSSVYSKQETNSNSNGHESAELKTFYYGPDVSDYRYAYNTSTFDMSNDYLGYANYMSGLGVLVSVDNPGYLKFESITFHFGTTDKNITYLVDGGDFTYCYYNNVERDRGHMTDIMVWFHYHQFANSSDMNKDDKCYFECDVRLVSIQFSSKEIIADSDYYVRLLKAEKDPLIYPHNLMDAGEVEPTCTDSGIYYRMCLDCDKIVEEYLNPLGHDFSNARITFKNQKVRGEINREDIILINGYCSRCNLNLNYSLTLNSAQDKSEYGLIDLKLPDTINAIGDEAFNGVSWLGSIRIPSSIKSIGKLAFASCYNLLNVYFENDVPPSIGSDVFAYTWDNDYFKIHVPCEGEEAYKNVNAEYWQESAVRRIYAHTVSNWEIIKKATCMERGEKTGKCDLCGKRATELTPYGDHDFKIIDHKKATCTNYGYNILECSICHVTTSSEDYSNEPLGGEHIWSDWEIVNENKENGDIESRRECKRCGEYEQKVDNVATLCDHVCSDYSTSFNSDGKEVKVGKCEKCKAKIYAMNFFDYAALDGDVNNGKLSYGAVVKWHIPNVDASRMCLQLSAELTSPYLMYQIFEPSFYTLTVSDGNVFFIDGCCANIMPDTYQNIGLKTDGFTYLNLWKFDIYKHCDELEIFFSHFCQDYLLMFGEDIRLIAY